MRAAGRIGTMERPSPLNVDEGLSGWWADQELNQGHQDFQSCALPTELSARKTGGL